MSTIFGEYTITKTSNESLDTINKYIVAIQEGKEVELIQNDENGEKELNEYVDEAVNIALFGSKEGNVKDVNEEYGITHGIFYSFFEFLTRSRTELKHVVNSIASIENKLKFTRLVLIISSFGGLLVKIFLINPITIGEYRIFMESRKYHETSIKRIRFCFTRNRYFKVVKSVFRKNLYKVLWDATIIGGFIKSYSYKMVPFL